MRGRGSVFPGVARNFPRGSVSLGPKEGVGGSIPSGGTGCGGFASRSAKNRDARTGLAPLFGGGIVSTVTLLRRFSAFAAARDEYLLTLEAEGRSPRTVDKYRTAIARLERFAGEIDPAAIDTALLRRWLGQLRADALSTTTQHDYLEWIKTWLRWLAEEGGYGVQAASFARAKPPRAVVDPIVPLAEAEIAKLFAACSNRTMRGQRIRAMLAVLLDTGLRAGELRGLRLCDVDLATGEIVILPETDKTRKGRTIALGRRAKLELGRYWSRFRVGRGLDDEPTAPLFIGETTGRPLKHSALQLILKRLAKRAGVADVHPHRFRHTFAIMALRGGMNPFALMHTLGHRDLAMTKKYMAIIDSDVRDQKRATSPLDKLKL